MAFLLTPWRQRGNILNRTTGIAGRDSELGFTPLSEITVAGGISLWA
jgi:hypothetical protein